MPRDLPMLLAVDSAPASSAPLARVNCDGLELSWLERVDGEPAGHHVLRVLGEGSHNLLRGAALPRWSVTTSSWAAGLLWSSEVRPRVLRHTDAHAQRLGVVDTAAALVIVERGSDTTGVVLEHELVVLAAFAVEARGQRRRPLRRLPATR